MKRVLALALVIALSLCLRVPAFGENLLEKPRPGQMISLVCGEGDWQGDFYLSAVSELRREGDDLCLYFAAARVRLGGFFAGAAGRRFSFLKGLSVGAEDFDGEGNFTGSYSAALSMEDTGRERKEQSRLDPGSRRLLRAELSPSGSVVTLEGEALWNAERTAVLDAIRALSGGVNPDWSKTELVELEFECGENGELRPVSLRLTGLDGLVVSSSRAELLWLCSPEEIYPAAAGRGSLCFENSLGESLCRMSFVCNETDSGETQLEFPCPRCGEEQGGRPHFTACGHFSCEMAGEEGHAVAQCSVAGHCLSGTSEEQHAMCRNCREPLCTGLVHGYGFCEHRHLWVVTAYTPPTASADGLSVSRCASCDAEYRETLSRFG